MSLVEDWEETTSRISQLGSVPGAAVLATGPEAASADLAAGATPIFSLDAFDTQCARGRGQVVALAAGNDCVTVLTSRAYILRYDYSQGSVPVLEVEISKAADATPRHVFMDASGTHTLAVLQTAAGPETHYLHACWPKPRPLAKLKGVPVSAVAFDAEHLVEGVTGEVLVGTETGLLHCLLVDEKDRKERLWAQLHQLQCAIPVVRGAYQQVSAGDAALVLVSTPSRLYVFLGGPGLQGAFSGYASRSIETINFVELPAAAGLGTGGLALHAPPGATVADRFAWMAEPGIYSGRLSVDGSSDTAAQRRQRRGASDEPTAELQCLGSDAGLIPYPEGSASQAATPIAVAATEHHVLVLFPHKVVALNAVSREIVQQLPLTGRSAIGNPLGLVADPTTGAIYLFTGEAVFEVGVEDEGRDMWAVHLGRREWRAAFRAARTAAHRNTVLTAEAEDAMAAGDVQRAAQLWGKVTAASPSFEEVALRLVEAGSPDALQTFLLTKLHTLGPADKAQATMVATWLTELYLDQINRALLDAHEDASNAAGADVANGTATKTVTKLEQQLQAFLKANVEVVDAGTTANLLASYGRMDDLMHFASYRQDSEAVVEHLVTRGDATRALALLRRPNVPRELVYKFAPALMAVAPSATVDAWLSAQPPLDPRRLLPALLRLGEVGAPPDSRAQALRYIHFALDRLQCEDAAVAALAVALYAAEEPEERLLTYLNSAHDALGNPFYDPHTALRVCRTFDRKRACVALLCEVGSYEDAVKLALTFDRQLAADVARRPDDEAARRQLWLSIAHHLFAQSSSPDGPDNIGQVSEFLREAGGAVKIEDVLPLFPDFARIDAFKSALCDGLADYNTQIQGLKAEMEDATRIADALRRDMAALEKRTAAIDLSEACAACERPLSAGSPATAGPAGGALPHFFLFPSGNPFHGACLCTEVVSLSAAPVASRIKYLQQTLAQAPASDKGAKVMMEDGSSVTLEAAVQQLEDLVAGEDPFSGESVVRQLTKPFVDLPMEAAELQSWAI